VESLRYPRRAAELLERFDLVEAGKKMAATYCAGMRRRLDLAMGLVGDPRIIFHDVGVTVRLRKGEAERRTVTPSG
jgi:ABC-2 type transport system ATP-binding protein